jgi:hypothetical protein
LFAIKYLNHTDGYVAGNGGTVIATSQTPILTSVEPSPFLATNFQLFQNFPNPFNPTTVIRFAVSATTNVELKVFNILGQEIQTLVNEAKPPGRYDLAFNAGSLASGVYFYRLKSGGSIVTKRLVLLR